MSKSTRYRLEGDRWEGVLCHDWQVDDPSAADFEDALRRLDATQFTIVTIAGVGEEHLAIGGGAGRYVVYATFDNHEFWNLVRSDSPSANGTVLLSAGGQEGVYPAAQVVGFAEARAAGLAYLRSGTLDPGQRWEKQ